MFFINNEGHGLVKIHRQASNAHIFTYEMHKVSAHEVCIIAKNNKCAAFKPQYTNYWKLISMCYVVDSVTPNSAAIATMSNWALTPEHLRSNLIIFLCLLWVIDFHSCVKIRNVSILYFTSSTLYFIFRTLASYPCISHIALWPHINALSYTYPALPAYQDSTILILELRQLSSSGYWVFKDGRPGSRPKAGYDSLPLENCSRFQDKNSLIIEPEFLNTCSLR